MFKLTVVVVPQFAFAIRSTWSIALAHPILLRLDDLGIRLLLGAANVAAFLGFGRFDRR